MNHLMIVNSIWSSKNHSFTIMIQINIRVWVNLFRIKVNNNKKWWNMDPLAIRYNIMKTIKGMPSCINKIKDDKHNFNNDYTQEMGTTLTNKHTTSSSRMNRQVSWIKKVIRYINIMIFLRDNTWEHCNIKIINKHSNRSINNTQVIVINN